MRAFIVRDARRLAGFTYMCVAMPYRRSPSGAPFAYSLTKGVVVIFMATMALKPWKQKVFGSQNG